MTVAGAGVCLAGAADLAQVYSCLTGGHPLGATVQRFHAPHTDLAPAEASVGRYQGGPAPASPKTRTRKVPRESQLAIWAAAKALHTPAPPSGDQVGTIWASSTAGMPEYGQMCVDAATLDPGLVSPSTGPQSAYHGPAAAVSIELGLAGPHLALTGDCAAGASAFVEASRMLHERQCEQVLVGGSAALSRWRLVDTGPDVVPAEGAACLLLSLAPGAVAVRPLLRSQLRMSHVDSVARSHHVSAGPVEASQLDSALADFVSACVARMSGPPAAATLSAAPAWRRQAMRAFAGGVPCWPVERAGGELGAAGGLQAIVAAVAACGQPGAGYCRVLALAVGDSGQAVAVEVMARSRWK